VSGFNFSATPPGRELRELRELHELHELHELSARQLRI